MLPVITAFLPPTHTHLYLPMLFKLWEAFNSHIIDDRLLELCGELSEEHVSGKHDGTSEDGIAEWKHVGIWSQSEWTVLATKALGAMSKCAITVLLYYCSDTSSRRTRRSCASA